MGAALERLRRELQRSNYRALSLACMRTVSFGIWAFYAMAYGVIQLSVQ